jgi:hypothetical protein
VGVDIFQEIECPIQAVGIDLLVVKLKDGMRFVCIEGWMQGGVL